jgi:hypothetical protein
MMNLRGISGPFDGTLFQKRSKKAVLNNQDRFTINARLLEDQ